MNSQRLVSSAASIACATRIVFCALALALILTFLWSEDSVAPFAVAAPMPAATAGRIVERWHGTVTDEISVTNSYASDCPWVCQGDFQYSDTQEWYFEVQEDGTLTGYIKTEVTTYSYQQSKTNNSCGPVAETNYYIEDCVFSGNVIQPSSTLVVHGKRELEEFTQKPVLRITSYTLTQECEAQWTARGYHSETHAVVHKEEVPECSRGFSLPYTLYIVTDSDGTSPQIPLSHSSTSTYISQVRVGTLVGTTEEPFLKLDREFLERSIFLDQVQVDEKYAAKLNWNTPDGGWLSWQLAATDAERIGPSTASEFPKTLNLGTQGTGEKTLKVQAKSTLNRASEPESTQIQVAPPPGWAGSPAEINATKVTGAVAYKGSIRFPNPAFEGIVMVPSIVPWLGGKQFGITRSQGAMAWEAKSTSEGQGSISGQSGLTAMGGGVLGSLGGKARVVLDESGISIPEGAFDIGIAGRIASKPEPLLKVVPSLNPALTAIEKISPRAAAFITERAQARLELEPKFDLSFKYFTENDEIKFKELQLKPSFGFKTIVEIKLIDKVLQAMASIGGTISATFKVPEPYFKEAALQGIVQAQIILYRWAFRGEATWNVVVQAASAAIASADDLWQGGSGSALWEPMERTYLAMPNYARWLGDSVNTQSTTQESTDEALVENLFPLANPSIHLWTNGSGQTRLAQAWTHDNPDSTSLSGGEIAVSRNFGNSWQEPIFLTNDNQDDFAPQVVLLTNNQTLLIWQRMGTATPPDFNSDPDGYLSGWQIVSQRIGGDDDLELISSTGSFNYRHQLAAVNDGALAIWVNNPANQLIGDTTNPDDILFARYTNATDSWSAAAPVLADVDGLLSLELATNGQHAAIIYARDTNNDTATTGDQELYYLTWNGATWSAPTRLTNNSVADESPKLALDASGQPLLVWRQNGALKFLKGGWSNAPSDLPLAGAAQRPDYILTRSSDGHLALLWQEVGPQDTRVAYAIYDATNNRWSEQLTMTPPEGAEGSMATSIAAALFPATEDFSGNKDNGKLIVAYLLAHIDPTPTTVEGVTIPEFPNIVQYDLHAATIPLRVNLSVSPSDLSLSGNNVQAVIHNTGELAVTNVPVGLHLGPADPVSGNTQVTMQTIPMLAAGSATTVTFANPNANVTLFVVEIDPEQTLQESDLTDNRAILGADVAIATLPTLYGPTGSTVRAQITQNSSRYISLQSNSILALNSEDGTVVGGSQFGFPLAPTAMITHSAFISTSLLGEGRHQLYWTLDPAQTLGDIDLSNNVAGTTIMILPDLAAVDGLTHFGSTPGNSAPFEMTVVNQGNWANAPTLLKVYDAPPGESTTQMLLSMALPTIQPGEMATITGTLQLVGSAAASAGLSGVYIQLDADDTVDESNENNNLIAAGAILEGAVEESGPLYLPSVRR